MFFCLLKNMFTCRTFLAQLNLNGRNIFVWFVVKMCFSHTYFGRLANFLSFEVLKTKILAFSSLCGGVIEIIR